MSQKNGAEHFQLLALAAAAAVTVTGNVAGVDITSYVGKAMLVDRVDTGQRLAVGALQQPALALRQQRLHAGAEACRDPGVGQPVRAQGRRRHPAAARVEPRRAAARQRVGPCLHVVGRQAQAVELGLHGRQVEGLCAAQQPGHGAVDLAAVHQRPQHLFGPQGGAAQPARMRPVVAVHDAVEQPAGVARGLAGRTVAAVEHPHGQPLRSQRAGHRRAGQAGTDHCHGLHTRQRLPAGRRRRDDTGREAGHRDRGRVGRLDRSGRGLQFEAGINQAGLQDRRRAAGGQRGARSRQSRQAAQPPGIPPRVAGFGGRAIEVERVDRGDPLGQHPGDVAQRQ